MIRTFINFTNHPSDLWNQEQTQAALAYGKIIDIPFPNISPNCTSDEIVQIGNGYCSKILEQYPTAVLCQGEFTLAFYVANQLKQQGITVLSACSERNTQIIDSEKRSIFSFIQFREYV